MFLDNIFNSQIHKFKDGFYLNHDNLMVATPEDKQRLIFYYIASQVPEKLNPADRSQFLQLRDTSVYKKSEAIGTLMAFSYAWTHYKRYIGTRINPRIFLNGTIGLFGSLFSFYIGQSLTYNVVEPRFIANNQVIGDLAQKYNFSVFDFAIAKKESHLKALRRELTADQILTGY
ncbi:hypothetical protein PPERSA_06427 [Pseudocohnilembus persalinus]|uniref:Uncharacterized protein n=1 Tax=Pseudocohnilembus persalinus TaxID=266149 RepID=A0A0V0QR97_PSEPJ|nr:hypothetical protein PPERSA_06427 [Pseudocohnilembus persalinus]|eukprot:KRX04793.1 hypothetical protein PPERSA_06427 [Pseudocohnilembus persalinus]